MGEWVDRYALRPGEPDRFEEQGRTIFITAGHRSKLTEIGKIRLLDGPQALAWCIDQAWARLGFKTDKRISEGTWSPWRARKAIPGTASEIMVRYRRIAYQTRAAMARTLGLSMPALANYETGRRGVPLDILRKAREIARVAIEGKDPDCDPDTGERNGIDLMLFAGDRRVVEGRAANRDDENDPELIAAQERFAAEKRRRSAIAAARRRRVDRIPLVAREVLQAQPVQAATLVAIDARAAAGLNIVPSLNPGLAKRAKRPDKAEQLKRRKARELKKLGLPPETEETREPEGER